MARPISKDHDRKRERILHVAARIFADQGYARASMAQVAAACGISKANIYHYYGSKDALLFDILDTYLRALRDRITGLDLTGLDPPAQLARITAETLRAYEGMDQEHKLQTEGMSTLAPDRQEVLRTYQRDLVAQMSAVVARVAPDVFDGHPRKLRAAVMSIFGMLNWFYMWNADAGSAARDDYAALVARLALTGVRGL